MIIKIFFSSKGKAAANVATVLQQSLNLNSVEVINLSLENYYIENFDFDVAIFICPTYGDEELEGTFESFLIQSNWVKHKDKQFCVIELGLYRGYDFVSLGAARIIQQYLETKKMELYKPILSLDSVPTYNEAVLKSWINKNFMHV